MTPAAVLSAHAWNSITGRCSCGGWEGNRVDHGAHQIEQLGVAGLLVVPREHIERGLALGDGFRTVRAAAARSMLREAAGMVSYGPPDAAQP
ncbi:MAG: hypothetical protein CMK98_13765 [Pseudomonas sp.]|nr:hypothetical protein [Pseudomonas sp.]